MASVSVNSFNLFVDNERAISSDSTGSNYVISLNEAPIMAGDNQFLRLTLMDFNMYRTWSNVNVNNNVIRVYQSQNLATPPLTGGGTVAGSPGTLALGYLQLDVGSPETRYDLALSWANSLASLLQSHIGAVGLGTLAVSVTTIKPVQNPTYPVNQIEFDLVWTPGTQAGHGLTDLDLRCYLDDGDAFELLGGNRVKNPLDVTSLSFETDVTTSATVITVRAPYSCQLSTQSHVYLRTDAQNTNLQTSSYNAISWSNGSGGSAIAASRLMAKITIQNDFASFNSSTSKEFQLDIQSKQLTSLRLFITDSHSRPVPLEFNKNITATGALPASQDILGNRSFECNIRVDLMELVPSAQASTSQSGGTSIQSTSGMPTGAGVAPLRNLNFGIPEY